MFAQYVQGGTFGTAVKMAEDVTDLAKRCAAAAKDNPDCLKPLVSTFTLLIWQLFSEVICHVRALMCVFPERHEHIVKRLTCVCVFGLTDSLVLQAPIYKASQDQWRKTKPLSSPHPKYHSIFT